MSVVVSIMDMISAIVNILQSNNVPGFTFSFWDFAVGSFLMMSGATFIKLILFGGNKKHESDDD